MPFESKFPQVVDLFFEHVFKLNGVLKRIVSDKDRIFISTFWKELMKLVGIEIDHITSYHPQINGQTKIVNKWLEDYLRNYMLGQQKAWVKWLHLA